MAPDEYLAWEREQDEKHEYWDGRIVAMSGGTMRHAFLTAQMSGALRAALRDCKVFSADLRVSIDGGRRYVYPDVTVVCGAPRGQPGTNDVLENPTIVVGVMSPSTGGHDATTKWEAYQRIGSLTDYLLVDQSRARIERYSRTGAEAWSYAAYGPGQHVPLSHGTTLEIDAIYAGAFELGTEAAQSG